MPHSAKVLLLYHLKNNIQQWPQFLQAHHDACAQTGEVSARPNQTMQLPFSSFRSTHGKNHHDC